MSVRQRVKNLAHDTMPTMNELILEITRKTGGGFVGECLTEAIWLT